MTTSSKSNSMTLANANASVRRTLHRAAYRQDVDREALEREACEHALRAALIIYTERAK